MSKANSTTPTDIERERATAEARADVLRRAEAQGVKPLAILEDFAGESELTDDFDVDEFVRAGAHAFLRKSADLPALTETVARLLARKEVKG